MTATPTLIFDLDDTLVATAGAWTDAQEFLLESLGVEHDESWLAGLSGRSARDVSRLIHARAGSAVSLEQVQTGFARTLRQAMERAPLEPKPGALGLLRRETPDWRKAVASGSPPDVIALVLARLGISDCFASVVSSEEVGEGKPSPKVFLEAARRTGASAEDCLVIEDSLVGVQAARNAGFACFAVPSRIETAGQIRGLADRTFHSLAEITADSICAALEARRRSR